MNNTIRQEYFKINICWLLFTILQRVQKKEKKKKKKNQSHSTKQNFPSGLTCLLLLFGCVSKELIACVFVSTGRPPTPEHPHDELAADTTSCYHHSLSFIFIATDTISRKPIDFLLLFFSFFFLFCSSFFSFCFFFSKQSVPAHALLFFEWPNPCCVFETLQMLGPLTKSLKLAAKYSSRFLFSAR